MRLAKFITSQMEEILIAWEAFARSLYPPATHMSGPALRDHAQQILEAIAADLESAQTEFQQSEKSMGRAPALSTAETAAHSHAVLRAKSGLDINQMAAEYRALRASVLRLWENNCAPGVDSLQDVIRFNEAIDQALTESVAAFTQQVDAWRNLVIGMLGHDMRTPLSAIIYAARYFVDTEGEAAPEMAQCVLRGADSLKALLDDLMDFSRHNLGFGMELDPRDVDLASLLTDELKVQNAAFPHCRFETSIQGDVRGHWDGRQLQRVIRNLVSNACSYGAKGEPIRVTLRGGSEEVCIVVANTGPKIEPAAQESLFEPLRRGALGRREYRSGSGLGLFIVREIARAHGGEVELDSGAEETVFTVHLPRAK